MLDIQNNAVAGMLYDLIVFLDKDRHGDIVYIDGIRYYVNCDNKEIVANNGMKVVTRKGTGKRK